MHEDIPHPRPQFQRENGSWCSLNGPWRFCYDDAKQFEHPDEIHEWANTIEVPFSPESRRSGIGDTTFHYVYWYEREFECRPWDGPVLLHFGAVDYSAKVWINGQYVGRHEGAYTPFSFNIAPYLSRKGGDRITVRAEDDPQDLAKPRGKQDWQLEPHSIWYPRTSGIWQSVWIEYLPSTYIERVRWSPHLERWDIGVEAFIRGPLSEMADLKVTLSLKDRVLARDCYQVILGEVHRRIALSDPGIDDFRNELLWSPEKPTLIAATLELWVEGQCVDRALSYTALRSVSVHQDRFMLNSRPYYLRLVLDQGYWPETLLTAPEDEAFRRDILLTKQMGFNGVRKHQKIEDPRYLYWADKLGLLVWEEMPSAYRFTHDAVERLVREWTAVLDRDYSHPCIVVWVPFNESWGVPDLQEKAAHRHCVQALYHLTKTLDPTRPVVGNDGWESTATDIIGIHDYDAQPQRIRRRYGPGTNLQTLLGRSRPAGRLLTLDGYRDQPVMLTEFGGIACTPEESRKQWGYSTAKDTVQFQARYAELLQAIHELELLSGFCYTQLTDTFQEANGLLDAFRHPKFPLEQIASATLGPNSVRLP